MKIAFSLILTVFLVGTIAAQELETFPQDSMFLGVPRKSIVTYSAVAYGVLSPYLAYQWWWASNGTHSFVAINDGFWNNYSLGVDKFGHFYISYLHFEAIHNLMRWAHFDKESSMLTALIFSGGHALFLELGDGFSHFAFSTVDVTANFLGIGYGYLQYKIPILKNFNPKWSYFPSGKVPLDKDFSITQDYDGHIYWMSIDVHNLLPESAKPFWPRFLNVAVGYGGKDISGRSSKNVESFPGNPARNLAIGLDYNLNEFPVKGDLWDAVASIGKYFRLPAPGVRIISDREVQPRLLLVE